MQSNILERQIFTMIIFSIIVSLFSFFSVLYIKSTVFFPKEWIELFNELALLNSLSICVVIMFSVILNIAYLRRKRIIIFILESFVSQTVGFIALATGMFLIQLISLIKVFNGFIINNQTLSVLLITIGLQVGMTYLAFVYLIRIGHYLILWITGEKTNSEDFKFVEKTVVKKLHSTTQFEKYYSILVVIVTVVWLNNDNIDINNAFENIFNANIWILIFSLSVYSRYIVMFLLKDNTLSFKELK